MSKKHQQYLMEDDVGVEGYVLVEGPLLHLSDEVPADSEEQEAVAEGEGGGGAPGHGDTDPHHMSQVPERVSVQWCQLYD